MTQKAERRAHRPGRALGAWLRATAVLAAVVVVDQLTKSAIRSSITPGEEHRFLPGVELVNTRNHGVAFGFLPGSHVGVTILIAVALVVLLGYFALHVTRPLIWLPTGLLIGGAIGNVVDRLRGGSVTDFVKLPLGWPPFNLADASITIGILLLFFVADSSRERRREGDHGGETEAARQGERAGARHERSP
jgi:signal peptidase II